MGASLSMLMRLLAVVMLLTCWARLLVEGMKTTCLAPGCCWFDMMAEDRWAIWYEL